MVSYTIPALNSPSPSREFLTSNMRTKEDAAMINSMTAPIIRLCEDKTSIELISQNNIPIGIMYNPITQ